MPAPSAYSIRHNRSAASSSSSSSSFPPPPVDVARSWFALLLPLLLLSLELHHVVHDGCIREELFLGHTEYRRAKHVKQQWRKCSPLPKTLRYVGLLLPPSIVQPHAFLHAVAELAGDGEHSRGHAKKKSKDSPHKGSVDGVICFGEVDKARVRTSCQSSSAGV